MIINNRQILLFFVSIFILSSVAVILNSSVIANLIIVIEIFVLLFSALNNIITNQSLSKKELYFICFFTLFVAFHIIINSSTSDKSILLKVVCPIVFFFSGKELGKRKFIISNLLYKVIFFSICFLPYLVRILQILGIIPNTKYYSIFVNSNNFAYYFLTCSIFIYFLTLNKTYVIIFLAIGFSLSKTIGAVAGLLIGSIVYFRKDIYKPRYLTILIIGSISSYILIFHSNIEVFERIKNSYYTFIALSESNNSISQFQNLEYGDAMQFAQGGESNLSFLFRIKNWGEIVNSYLKSEVQNILFGNGFGSVPKITTTHLVAHNDYLGLLYELGLLPLIVLLIGYFSVLNSLKQGFTNFIFFGIAVYHFTENLYYNFLVTALHFFLLGVFYYKNKSA